MLKRSFYTARWASLCAALIVTTGLQRSHAEDATVIISEFMAANDSVLRDDDGDYSDWIELHNYGTQSVDLNGFSLTDDVKDPGKWAFPNVTMEPASYLVVFASGKDRQSHSGELHTNFKLGVKGEYLALVSPDGKTTIHEFAPNFPDQKQDVSYGISADWKPGESLADAELFLFRATPREPNSIALQGTVEPVKVSHKRGFYDDPIELNLSTGTIGAVIKYTTNGSAPTPDNGNTYTIVPTDGSTEAWNRLYDRAAKGLESNEAYFALQGRNPDGTANPKLEPLMDVDNLISYMMIIFWGGNLDAPVTKFGGNRGPNNWHGIRNRNGTHGFHFFVWDAEHTLLDVNEDRTGPFNTGASVDYSSPQWLWQQCLDNAEFRLRVADHIHEYFFNDGLLTEDSMRKRILDRTSEIESAVICESARWGDVEEGYLMAPPPRYDENGAPITGPFNRDDDWRRELDRVLTDYLPKRSSIVLAQLYQHGLIPDIQPPQFSDGSNGVSLNSATENAEIFFTTDGTDPRAIGGEVSSSAKQYQNPVHINGRQTIKARARASNDWSALSIR